MTGRPLVIVGISGFGRETADIATALDLPIKGFLDDNPSEENLELIYRRGSTFLGSVSDWLTGAEPHDYIVGIGSGGIRQRIADSMDPAGHTAISVIHPSVTAGFDVRIGPGSVICAGVRMTNNITIGRHVHLNLNATVGHDATLCDFVSVNPTANISGGVTIGSRTLIGVGATVLQNLTVGEDVTVGASALVVKDVPRGITAVGVPARWPSPKSPTSVIGESRLLK